jgi:hypothetical protein
MHGPTPWSTHQQHGESAPAAGSAELSMPWAGTNLAFPRGQSYPSIHGGALHPGTLAGGSPISPLSTGVMSNPPQHWSGGDLFNMSVNTLNASARPNHQVTSVMAVNNIGDMVAAPPAASAYVALPPQTSITKTGRRGPKRGMPGRMFEPNLEHVEQRLRLEGGDAGAINNLRSDIFVNGIITRAALKLPMSPDQRRTHHGTQKYMLLVERVLHSHRGVDHRCLLCPFQERVEFKNQEDTLRHLYKDHFGLSVDCEDW